MLKLMRNKKVTKFVLWGTLILILPAFVIWGAGSIGKSKEKGPTYAGLIDGKKISFDDFAGSLGAVRCQIFLNYFSQPQVLDAIMKNKEFSGKLAWDMLVMSREAKKRKIKVSDAEVITFIQGHPLFSRGGKFDDRIYEYILRNNLSVYPRSFEEIVRNNLAVQKMNNTLTKDIKVTDEEILDRYKIDNKDFDEEKFKKEKDEYSRKALDAKKNKYLEDWLRGLESNTKLLIDLKDYEKYYR
ncbi:MAG: SurA N-terminal domain-containing protein [Candidatus Omnitrophota bacterium]